MRLSSAAELAVRGMVVLAKEYGNAPTTLMNVCSSRNLPREYLTKIFSMLTRAGLINPVRGKRGGYSLARDPSSISLLKVIEAVEGPVALNLCQHVPPKCDDLDCPIRKMWSELQATTKKKLAAMTLQDCIPQKRVGASDDRHVGLKIGVPSVGKVPNDLKPTDVQPDAPPGQWAE